jgi:uncharacterized membrane protein YqjE
MNLGAIFVSTFNGIALTLIGFGILGLLTYIKMSIDTAWLLILVPSFVPIFTIIGLVIYGICKIYKSIIK